MAAQLNDAIINQWHVEVYQHDESLDQGGVIDYQTKDIIKMKDGHYFIKSKCGFLVQSKDSNGKVGNFYNRLFGIVNPIYS